MKKIQLAFAIAAIALVSACHNPNSSTAQEVDDEIPAATQDHGGAHGGSHSNSPKADTAGAHRDTTHHADSSTVHH